MRLHLLHLPAVLLPLLAIGCPSETPALCDNGACDADGGTPDGSSSGGGDSGGDVIVPAGCDLTKDPKDSPNCVASEVGIFVDAATGNDGNSGTKELPVKTIAGAQAKLAGRPRIYVCEGTYPESVKLTSPVSIFGGFACTSWEYTGTKARISPSVRGVALSIAGASSVVVADIEATSLDASESGESSTAILVANASNVTLRRVTATAGKGMNGSDASNQTDFTPGIAPDGTGGANGGTETSNPACTTSKGGRGGSDATPNGVLGQVPVSPVYPNLATGVGGSTGGSCAQGLGANGSYGLAGPAGAGAIALGSLDVTGWKPAAGTPGGKGGDGQGGGGGAQVNTGGVGGSGAPGGCGGAGGGKGTGGGSSIALAVFQSSVALEQSSLVAKDAGRGGNGGKGQKAQLASAAQASPNGANGCAGGFGGIGGSGGGGGGGAGGISAGVVYKGSPPRLDGAEVAAADTHASVTLGQKGAAGLKGFGGDAAQSTPPASRAGTEGSDGIAGVAKAIMASP